MPNRNNSGSQELDDLLRQMDALLDPEKKDTDFDIDEYAPEGLGDEEPILYQNYSNRYGAEVRNFSNGYGMGRPAPMEEELNTVSAYNADFHGRKNSDFRQEATQKILIREDFHQEPEEYEEPRPKKRKKTRRRKGRGMGCLASLILFVLSVVLIFSFVFQPPKSHQSIGSRKRDTATILLCGTDWEGARTDTMMLLYLSGSEHRVGLLSLPRDTLTITSGGNRAKLNSAYGRNGYQEKGMEGLLDYVQEIIGYRPDGYMLLNMDLGRVEVQRKVISACLDQWFTLDHLKDVSAALELVENNSLSTLNVRNYLWVAKTVLLSMGDMSTDTLPGYADYIGDVSYYILNRDEVAALINEHYNPYKVEISPENLKIAG